MKLAARSIHQLADGRFRVRIILHRVGQPEIRVESDYFSTLAEAEAWRDENRPARLVSGVKGNTSKNAEYHRIKSREKWEREKAKEAARVHVCIMCKVSTPETLCPACKTDVQGEAVEITIL